MDKSLEELKRQRALIQQHLQWLDAEIAKQSPQSEQAGETEPQSIAAEVAASEPEATEGSKPTIIDAVLPKGPQVHGDIKVARIGCVAFFVLGIAGFLFFLFGLPYLLD